MKKLLSIVGVRPQFVKAAMVCAAVDRHNNSCSSGRKVRHLLLNTGQHYDHGMADVFFQQLPLPQPDYNLGVGSGTHAMQTAAMLERIEMVLIEMEEVPDYVIVYGDTNSTLAGVLAAAKLNIPVVHVESGLRSFNRRMPEEINRIVADHVASVLLCPTHGAVEQLQREGITENVYFTGDVMLDAVQTFASVAAKNSNALRDLGVAPKNYILVTVHRAENTDSRQRAEELVETLCSLGRPTIFSMHPRLRAQLDYEYQDLKLRLAAASHIKITPPLPYLDMLHLESNAQLIMTDSGGVQKEAYFVATPCLTLREETEWTETLKDGWNQVVGTSPEKILPIVKSMWSHNGASPTGKPVLSAFGDGHAGDNILEILAQKELTANA